VTSLIACLTTGKGSWAAVSELMNSENWTKIFLITNKFGTEKFTSNKELSFIIIDPDSELDEIKKTVIRELKGKILDTEVAFNMMSGTGKEHMAILSAILNSGFGVRLVTSENKRLIVH